MANRYFQQFRYSFVKKLTDLYCKATIAAAGAPTLVASASEGITSIARTGTGTYVITLNDRYTALVDAKVTFQLASGTPATIAHCLKAETVGTTKTVTITTLDAAGAAADPDSGASLLIHLELRNSSLTR